MIDSVRRLFHQFSELIRYGFWGVITVIVNTTVYLILCTLGLENITANTIAFFITVQVAYVTNTHFVFHQPFTRKNFIQFWGMRIGVILVDDGGMWLLLSIGWNNFVAKCVVNVVGIILNYLFSKFIIYKKQGAV